MNKRTPLVLFTAALCFGGVACEQSDDPSKRDTGVRPSEPVQGPVAPDNTAKNEADRDSATKTPIDQAENSADVTITAEIRRAVMKAENMSVNAQNCKIMTEQGAVTLRGPVDSQVEKDAIAALAKSTAGVVTVDNQLEVKNP